ncbi:hypothetical protein OROGR_027323 [Orobanche gracilis]
MSRICVKNLPKHVLEDRLREHFSQKGGEITDVKLMRTKDGKSRQFAFIGFRSDHEAQEAIRYFNRSYLDTSRITCEVAQKLGDANLPRPWSRYSKKKDNKDTTPDANKHGRVKGQGDKSKDIVDIDDPQLQDFLQVMQPRAMSKLWANDTSIVSNNSNHQAVSNKDSKGAPDAIHPISVESASLVDGLPNNPEPNKSRELDHHEVISDMDYFKSRVTSEWSDSESSDSEGDTDDDDDDDDKDNHSHASDHEENFDKNLSERTPSKCAQELDLEGQEDSCGEGVARDKAHVNATKQESLNPEDAKGVFESSRLFVRNLPYTTTEEELHQHFSSVGTVSEVHLVIDKDTKRSKGIVYIRYSSPEFAARAVEKLDNLTFQGRLLHVMPAIQRPSNKEENNVSKVQNSKTLKQRREEQRKAAEASGDTRAWNSLFMRSDTGLLMTDSVAGVAVVENIARKYGVSKSDLLDPEADGLAVRIALGETQVITETKKALTIAGVNVESMEELAHGKVDGLKRSNHVLLVKNLPYGVTESELVKMFGKFGSLDKIILPPTKTLALVIFLEPAEAKAAFRGLAYKCYRDAPLYLEWAPFNILSQSSMSKSNEMNGGIGENDAKRLILEQNVERISDVDIDPDRAERWTFLCCFLYCIVVACFVIGTCIEEFIEFPVSRTLFVKNLNFQTTEESLRKHLNEHIKEGRLLSEKAFEKWENVSMGVGFVEFDSMETASNVCRDLQGTVLDGHALILQLCHAKNDRPVPKSVENGKHSTKLLVRNVAFEATAEELRNLFSPFGQIKSLRLPMKFGSQKGFAFIEYCTQQEAQNALTALRETHLRGRHLVIERAKEGESLDELRARTAAQFNQHNEFENAFKLCKKRKLVSILDGGER